MHAGLDCRKNDQYDDFTDNLTRLQAMGVKWVVWYTPSPDAARICEEESLKYGIMPIIRPKTKINQPCDFGAYARACLPKTYIQIYNEPGNEREWNGGVPRDYIPVWAGRWQNAARDVVANGGLPGLQAIGEAEFKAALTGLDPAVAQWVWIASHAVPSNHPPDYPYNDGYTVFKNKAGEIEELTQLKFLLDAEWAKAALGFYPPLLVTEEGYVMNKMDDQEEISPGVYRYPRIDVDLHARYSVAIYDQFRLGKLANGDPLPDWWFAHCPYLWGGTASAQDWQDFAWFLGAGNPATKQQTIDAVTAIPPFVRTFGGAAPPEPPDDPELEEAIAAATRATQALQDALVDMDGVLGYLKTLR